MQLVGKVLLKKIRVMSLMQFQASLGMCLQDSKTNRSWHFLYFQMEKIQKKQNENK